MGLLLWCCGAAHWRKTQGVTLLIGERDVFAGVWAAEKRVAGDENVDYEADPDGVERIAEVWSVAHGLDGDAGRLLDGYGRSIRGETHEERYGFAKKERRRMARFRTTIRASAGLKQLAFWRRTISSMRGCCHLPGVVTAGEALGAAEGVAGPF